MRGVGVPICLLVSVLWKAYCRRFAGARESRAQQSQLVNPVCLYADRQIQCCQANWVCKTALDHNADDCGIVAGAHFVLQVWCVHARFWWRYWRLCAGTTTAVACNRSFHGVGKYFKMLFLGVGGCGCVRACVQSANLMDNLAWLCMARAIQAMA